MMRRMLSLWTEERSLSIFLVLLVIQIFVVAPLETTDRFFLYMMNGVVGSLFLLTGLLTITQHRLARWHRAHEVRRLRESVERLSPPDQSPDKELPP